MKPGLASTLAACTAALLLAACGDDDQVFDAGTDAAADAGDADSDTDSDTDPGMDASIDAGPDASLDAGDTASDTASGDGTCEPVASLELGAPVVGSTSGETNDLDDYACTALDESGPDVAYSYTNTSEQPLAVTAWLYGLGEDLDLFWLRGACAAAACDAHSATAGDELAELVLAAGETAYVAIDGYLGAAGAFQLQLIGVPVEVDCGDALDDDADGLTDCADDDCGASPDCAATCAADQPIACGASVSASTAGLDGGIDSYPGLAGDFSGPELIYELSADGGVAAAATLGPAAAGLELIVLAGECAADAVLAAGPGVVSFEPADATDYFLVVDGRDGGAGSFTLELACRETACLDARDNDGDGPIDCADPDCELAPGCVAPCAVLATDAGCPADAGSDGGAPADTCYLLPTDPPAGFCHAPGTADAGAPCAAPYDCRPGAVCTPADVCLVACDLDDGLPGCDAGTCTSIGADPVGVCW